MPVSRAELAGGMVLLRNHAKAVGMHRIDLRALGYAYSTSCATMPGALFQKGLRGVLANWRNTYSLPPPGAVLDWAREEWALLTANLRKLRLAEERAASALRIDAMPRRDNQQDPVESHEDFMARIRADLDDVKSPQLQSALGRFAAARRPE